MKYLEADIAVISAGAAGMAATVTAVEGGARVSTFEKRAYAGGSGGSGLFAVESRVQNMRQYALTREEAFKMYMEFTHWRVNARLVKTLIDKSAATIDWLESLGVEFDGVESHGFGNAYTWHLIKTNASYEKPGRIVGNVGPAGTLHNVLAERALSLGAKFYLKSPVKKILRQNGRITGVIATDESGEELRVNARAVISATGGHSVGAMPGMAGGIGDGIRLAKEVGAAVKESDTFCIGKMGPPPVRGKGREFPLLEYAKYQPGLWVNVLGERFMDETIVTGFLFSGNAICRQPGQSAFVILDVNSLEHYARASVTTMFVRMSSKPVYNVAEEMNGLYQEPPSGIFIADNAADLCAKTGIDLNNFNQTLMEYNDACETGRDETFGKNIKHLIPVSRPPFIAIAGSETSIINWNGIRVNHKTEVLTPEYKVIPGLYAAGLDIGSELYYDTYPFNLPATAMGFAINSGRLAAENAIKYISGS